LSTGRGLRRSPPLQHELGRGADGPAFGFTVVGLVIVFGPLVAERLRLPGLLGLLTFGAVIGPNMLDVLPRFTGLQAVGSIGVLYLIFLAGLQLDLEAFVRYRVISGGFGLLTAFIPMALGTGVALLLGIDPRPALLIGSFWASFTLIAYPTVAKYGLTKTRPVAAIVGASAITDGVSLVVLALIVGAETGDASGARLVLDIAIGFAVLGVYCFVVFPAIARWFFTGLGQERTLRYMLVFIGLTSSAVVAELVGVEPLIGAFFIGVGLNRLVPNASPLMAVTDFFGNAFFIPTFLVSVGLLFDPAVMFEWSTIRLALGFVAALVVGKAIAAWITGRIFGLVQAEIGLLFSMSVAQAAATLAATVIGFNIGLYGSDVVNAVMVVVAVSLIVTSSAPTGSRPRSPRLSASAGGQARRSSCRPSARSTGSPRCCGSAAISPTRPAGSSSRWCRSPRRWRPTSPAAVRSRRRSTGCCVSSGATRRRCCGSTGRCRPGCTRRPSRSTRRCCCWGGPARTTSGRRWWARPTARSSRPRPSPSRSRPCTGGVGEGRVILYSVARELVPGNLPTMALALELASTLSRHRDEAADHRSGRAVRAGGPVSRPR
jgi:Kef-type K+ transport system membrane component KefB